MAAKIAPEAPRGIFGEMLGTPPEIVGGSAAPHPPVGLRPTRGRAGGNAVEGNQNQHISKIKGKTIKV